MELIDLLTRNLGISPGQAEGGVGLVFKAAQSALAGGDFQKLAQAVPGVDDMIGKAPDAGGGLLGAVGGLLGSMGGGAAQLGNMAQLAEGFSKLNLNPELVAQFLPIVLQFLQKQEGGGELTSLLEKVLKP